MRAAFITGLAGTVLTAAEASFLRITRPAGLILFARNAAHPGQVRRLVAQARAAIGSDHVLVLIDQEGGRVQRLRPPHWRALPAARSLAASNSAAHIAHQIARLTAADLRALGINTNCAPVLDIPVADAHDVIGDRAYATGVTGVVALARAVAEGYRAGGVVPVIKHIPGHGRARADSHHALPVVETSHEVLSASDFAPFAALREEPAAMTAHVLFSSIDPTAPASTSELMHRKIIRGEIGFDGLLMSDDLSMRALAGPMRARAEAVIAAGSDLALHCNGTLAEMEEVAAGVPSLSGASLVRFERAIHVTRTTVPFDQAEAEACLASVLRLSA